MRKNRKKLLEGTHEEVISCLRKGMKDILHIFYSDYRKIPYKEFRELKKIYAILETLIQIELLQKRKEETALSPD